MYVYPQVFTSTRSLSKLLCQLEWGPYNDPSAMEEEATGISSTSDSETSAEVSLLPHGDAVTPGSSIDGGSDDRQYPETNHGEIVMYSTTPPGSPTERIFLARVRSCLISRRVQTDHSLNTLMCR